MMREPRPDPLTGSLFLLLLLVALNRLANGPAVWCAGPPPSSERVYVQVSGDVPHPGVYGFSSPPAPGRLIAGAGGPGGTPCNEMPERPCTIGPGSWIELKTDGNLMGFREKTMSAFYRVTLGIPLLVNCETREGLTAIPGIGNRTADAIVRLREREGCFQKLDQLLAVPGIGPAIIRKMRPYVALSPCRQRTGGPRAFPTESE